MRRQKPPTARVAEASKKPPTEEREQRVLGNTLDSGVDFGNFPKRMRLPLLQRDGPPTGSGPAEGGFGGPER